MPKMRPQYVILYHADLSLNQTSAIPYYCPGALVNANPLGCDGEDVGNVMIADG
jgi:hypothetical protein